VDDHRRDLLPGDEVPGLEIPAYEISAGGVPTYEAPRDEVSTYQAPRDEAPSGEVCGGEPAAVARMRSADRVVVDLGVAVTVPAPGRAVARMPVTERMVNGHAVAHGGYVFLLADVAFAYACNGYGPVTLAAGAEIEFVAPVHLGDELVAEAAERARFGRSGIYDVRVSRADGTLVAEFRGRSRTLRETPTRDPAAQDLGGGEHEHVGVDRRSGGTPPR